MIVLSKRGVDALMNIFYLDSNPIKAAQYHCDKHVVKMILETAQLLSTCQRLFGNTDKSLYKSTHINHPSAVWIRESRENYRWTYALFMALNHQYSVRYGKRHKCMDLCKSIEKPPRKLRDVGMTKPAMAMPDEYKHINPVVAYRSYYCGEKRGFASWKTGQPFWWG